MNLLDKMKRLRELESSDKIFGHEETINRVCDALEKAIGDLKTYRDASYGCGCCADSTKEADPAIAQERLKEWGIE